MEAIAQLHSYLFLLKSGGGNRMACIDWAIERLLRDDEGDDLDIVLLAAAAEQSDVAPLVERIIERYCGEGSLDEYLAAGKYVASLHDYYLQGYETTESLDAVLSRIYSQLAYPEWLVMLSRNCEYATDIPAFEEPFEKEFAYVAGLWEAATTRADFDSKYSREISNQHDAKFTH